MAGFNTAVTGIKATTTALDVAGNNIANASTVGFKATRTEFADIYSTQVVGAGSANVAGSGVLVSDLAQDFSGGTIEFTNSNLDLAVNGSGFYQLDDGNNGFTYTRAGAFELDKEGFIVSKNSKYLRGYGLDDQGNQLPVGRLQVKEKESPPHPTENIALSVNLEPAEDLSKKADYYSKTNSASYAYTTTIETYDSLGNTHAIKYNYVEQKAQREQFTYDLGAATTFNIPDSVGGTGAVVGVAAGATLTAIGGKFPAPIPSTATAVTHVIDPAEIAAIEKANPTVDPNSIVIYTDGGANYVTFERKSEYNGTGDMVVKAAAAATLTDPALIATNKTLEGNPPVVSSAEEIRLTINTSTGATDAFGNSDSLLANTSINIGGVDITLEAGLKRDDVGDKIVRQYEADIKAKNPLIESVTYDDNTNELVVTWKPEAGNIADGDFTVVAGDATTTATGHIFELNGGTAGASPEVTLNKSNKRDGDNSYDGVYRLYAYLNDEQLLDIGKPVDAGEPATATGTEPGPIILKFSPNNGTLSSVNGQQVNDPEDVPNLRIFGADQANPNDDIQPGDLDQLAGVQLDISGSTRWESPTIVKGQSQDGYAKGDLIGVTFDERGYMVAAYSNGQKKEIGIVALATFESQSGLQPAGDTEWVPTLDSGQASLNPPGTGLNGSIRSGALEQSNVDLSAELVKLIEYQRNYQANSKTLETLNTVTQSILQI